MNLEEIASKINALHGEIDNLVKLRVERCRELGNLLIQVKAATLLHKGFHAWIKQHCQFTVHTARIYMRVADRWPEIEEYQKTRKSTKPMGAREAAAVITQRMPERRKSHSAITSRIAPPYDPIAAAKKASTGDLAALIVEMLVGRDYVKILDIVTARLAKLKKDECRFAAAGD